MKNIEIKKVWDSKLQKAVPYEVHFENDFYTKVEIIPVNRSYTKDEKITYGVNWSGIGTQTIENAQDYARLIVKATEVAGEMNK